jgi:basic membrane protein A
MKKSILWRVLVLMLVAVFVLSACNGGAAPADEESVAEEAGGMQIPDIVDGKFNVALVMLSVHDDGGWSQAQWEGLTYLEENLDVHTAYIESVAEGADAEQVFRALARKGFDLIFGGSFGYMDSMEAVAPDFPDQYFVHISGFKSNGENFGDMFGAMEDMKYLAGMIAGSRNKIDGETMVGYMATFPIPEELRLGNAFALGMQQTCPECEMQVRWINTWHDPVIEREAAESLFDAGCNIVYTGADTPASALAAEARGDVWGITYDWVGSCTSERCLTAPYWNWGPVFAGITEEVMDGTYKFGGHYFDADANGLGIFGLMEGQEMTPGMKEIEEAYPEDMQMIRETLDKMLAGEFTRFDIFTGPIVDNQGNVVLEDGVSMVQADIDCFSSWGYCDTGMYWWNENVAAELPETE